MTTKQNTRPRASAPSPSTIAIAAAVTSLLLLLLSSSWHGTTTGPAQTDEPKHNLHNHNHPSSPPGLLPLSAPDHICLAHAALAALGPRHLTPAPHEFLRLDVSAAPFAPVRGIARGPDTAQARAAQHLVLDAHAWRGAEIGLWEGGRAGDGGEDHSEDSGRERVGYEDAFEFRVDFDFDSEGEEEGGGNALPTGASKQQARRRVGDSGDDNYNENVKNKDKVRDQDRDAKASALIHCVSALTSWPTLVEYLEVVVPLMDRRGSEATASVKKQQKKLGVGGSGSAGNVDDLAADRARRVARVQAVEKWCEENSNVRNLS